jgi:hypothetical protein
MDLVDLVDPVDPVDPWTCGPVDRWTSVIKYAHVI